MKILVKSDKANTVALVSAWKAAVAMSVHPNPDLRSSAVKGAAMRP
jgi:hypothetical protein